MLSYEKGDDDCGLTGWRATPGANWGSLGDRDKQPIREALARDQGQLCAYCQRRIEPNKKSMKIEHWQARNDDHSDFDWANLLGVCRGLLRNSTGQTIRTCDTARGNRSLFLHPVLGRGPNPRDHLRYLGNGQIRADDSRVARDIETLNLCAEILDRGRRVVIDEMKRRLTKRNWSIKVLKDERKRINLSRGCQVPEYADVARYFLDRWLQKKGIPV